MTFLGGLNVLMIESQITTNVRDSKAPTAEQWREMFEELQRRPLVSTHGPVAVPAWYLRAMRELEEVGE